MRIETKLRLATSLTVLAVAAGCSSSSLTKVDITAENKPPLPIVVSGAGITIPEGIAVAVVINVYVDNKKTDDTPKIQSAVNVTYEDGINKSEFFIVGGKPGPGSLTIGDYTKSDVGTVSVPVTVTAQAVVVSDGGAPADSGSSGDSSTSDTGSD